MKLSKKFILYGATTVVSISGVAVAISCSSTDEQTTTVTMGASTSWFTAKVGVSAVSDYESAFDTKAAELLTANPDKYPNAKTIKLSMQGSDDKTSILNDLKASKLALGVLQPQYVVNLTDANLVSSLQTLTQAFKENLENDEVFYSDSNGPAKLSGTLVEWMNNKLNSNPYQSWTNDTYNATTAPAGMTWDGTKYAELYDLTQKVDYYRGMMFIVGDEETRSAIKKAWTEKDWTTFISYGVVHGKSTKQARYLLANQLLKNHFGESKTGSNPIQSIIDAGKSKVADANTIENGFRIYFDDMYAWAWQNNKDGTKQTNYFKPADGETIEVLSLTNPLKYDIIVFNTDLINEDTRNLFMDTIIALSNEGKDPWGLNSGYNGYKKITDFNTEVKEPYEKAFK